MRENTKNNNSNAKTLCDWIYFCWKTKRNEQHYSTAHYTRSTHAHRSPNTHTHTLETAPTKWMKTAEKSRKKIRHADEREGTRCVSVSVRVPKCPYKEYEMSTWEKQIHEQNWNNIKSQLLDSVFLSNLRRCASMCLSVGSRHSLGQHIRKKGIT